MSIRTDTRILVNGEWTYGPPPNAARSRDPYWLAAYDVAKKAIDGIGRQCVACGGYLWDRTDTGRLYCDDTCKRRHYRRRGRYREFLREHEEACQLCGCEPPS